MTVPLTMPATDVRLVFAPTGRVLDNVRACEADIFWQEYGVPFHEHVAEFEQYEEASVFVALVDRDDEVHGLVRLLPPGTMKTLDQLQQPPWSVDASRSAAAARIDLSSTWDVATMGVRPGAKSLCARHSLALYHGLIQAARANEATTFLAILDERVRRLLNSVGIVMHTLPGASAQPFEGSRASTPVYASMGRMLDRQRRELPDAHRLVTMGIGLSGVSVPPREAFRHAVGVPVATEGELVVSAGR